MHDYDGRKIIINDACKLITLDSQLAAEYFAAALKEKNTRRNNSHLYSSQSRQISQQNEYFEDLLEESDRQGVTFLQWCQFQSAFETLKDPVILSTGLAERYDLDDLTEPFYRNLDKPKNLKEEEKELFKSYHWDSAPKAFAKQSIPVQKIGAWLMWLHWVETYNYGDTAPKYWKWMENSKYAERYPIFSDMQQTLLAARSWNSLSPEARQTARKAWTRILSDSDLTTRFRMEIACKGLDQQPNLSDSAEALQVITQLFKSYAEEEHPLYSTSITDFLTGLLKVKTKLPEEEWNELLEKNSEAFLKLAASQRSNSTAKSRYARTLINLGIRLEAWESCKETMALAREDLRGDIELMLTLVKAEQTPLARQLTTNPSNRYKKPSNLKYNPQLAETSKILLDNITNEKERYRIHCLIASLPNGKKPLDTTRNQRLKILAEEFTEKAPKIPQARHQCLEALITNQETISILQEEFRTISNRFTAAQSTEQDQMPGNLSATTLNKLLTSYLWHEAKKGNLKPADRHFRSLAEIIMNSSSTYSARRTSSALFLEVFNGFLDGLANNPEASIQAEDYELSKEWYLLFAHNKSKNHELPSRLVAFPFCLHALGGKAEEFHNWVETLPEEQQEAYQEQIKNAAEIPSTWSYDGGWRIKSRAHIRKFYLERLFADHFVSQTCYSKHLSTSTLTRKSTARKEELEEALKSIAVEHPQSAHFKLALGMSVMRGEKGDLKEGIKLVNEALEIATEREDVDLQNIILAELVGIHGDRRKALKKAIEIGEQVDWNRVPQKTRNTMKNLMKRFRSDLAKRAEKKAKEEEEKKEETEPAETP